MKYKAEVKVAEWVDGSGYSYSTTLEWIEGEAETIEQALKDNNPHDWWANYCDWRSEDEDEIPEDRYDGGDTEIIITIYDASDDEYDNPLGEIKAWESEIYKEWYDGHY